MASRQIAFCRLVDRAPLLVGQERGGRLLDELLKRRCSSSRGCRRRSRCRACRPVPAPRRAGACRGSARRSTRRPNADVASRTADSYSSAISRRSRATFIPRPPPPNAALIAIGRPCSSANASTSAAPTPGPGCPTRGRRAHGDVPRRDLVAEVPDGLRVGPIQIIPASITACAKSAFSLRNP